MVLSLFLPTYSKQKLFLSQKVLSLAMRDGFFVALSCIVSPNKMLVKSNTIVPFNFTKEQGTSADETAASELQKIISSLGSFDQIIITESSATSIFKEIELPFNDREKIALILEEELEPHLPFSPIEGHTGFAINDQTTDGAYKIITATLKKNVLHELFSPYQLAHVAPTGITVDAQGIVALISATQPRANEKITLRIIVDPHENYTQLIFAQGEYLRTVKNITIGKSHLFSKDDKLTLNTEKYAEWIDKILFSADALGFKFAQDQLEQSLFFMQPPEDTEQLLKNLSAKTTRAVEVFSHEACFSKEITLEGSSTDSFDSSVYAAALGSVLLVKTENKISLTTEAVEETTARTISHNIYMFLLLIFLSASSLSFFGYQQISQLEQTLEAIEKNQLKKLSEKFPVQFADMRKPTLKRAISTIEDFVKEQEINMFGGKNLRALEFLYELTQLIDQRAFNLNVSAISFTLSEDDKSPRAALDGIFKSKTDAHYSDFGVFEKHLNSSKGIMLTKDTENSYSDDAHGVKFTARFKMRDSKEEES
ncbi:hypothetical protein FJ366_03790 [Candidatus Dependentiae bacterium]|nr:hypothetical protein [Candidatus Dependentiae bacterium]